MEKFPSFTLRSLNTTQQALSNLLNKLSTASRITQASDDAAGLSVGTGLRADSVMFGTANNNIGYGTSALRIAGSALTKIGDITTRLSELATQAAHGTLSDDQRGALQTEYDALVAEVERIGATTEFNGQPLLDGRTVSVQAGRDSSPDSQISVQFASIHSLASGLSRDISTQGNAQSALASIENFSEGVSAALGRAGAVESRLNQAYANNETQKIGSEAAASRILDLDFAVAVAEKTRLDILQQANVAVLAHGSLSQKNVLDLLT